MLYFSVLAVKEQYIARFDVAQAFDFAPIRILCISGAVLAPCGYAAFIKDVIHKSRRIQLIRPGGLENILFADLLLRSGDNGVRRRRLPRGLSVCAAVQYGEVVLAPPAIRILLIGEPQVYYV